jgi:hypothetical protein
MARPRSAGKTNNSANIGFEAKLWLAADKLRSNMDAAEYKHVVPGLIFLKCMSAKRPTIGKDAMTRWWRLGMTTPRFRGIPPKDFAGPARTLSSPMEKKCGLTDRRQKIQ